jgi:hypothetical protein
VKVKLLMSWDIRPGLETAYFNFVVHEFAPAMSRLGLKPIEAWYTVYGEAPQILTSGETDDLKAMERILQDASWQQMKQKLLSYVMHFRQKVVPSTDRFQLL